MKSSLATLALALPLALSSTAHADEPASKPLYRDPVFDGAADVSIVYDRAAKLWKMFYTCLLYTSPSPRDRTRSRMPSSA